MKKIWKWIIGIVVGLVIVAALVAGVVFLTHSQLPFRGEINGWVRPELDTRGPGMMPFGDGGRGWGGWHMRGPGMMGFGGGLMWLFPLGFLVLFVLGIVWLVKKLTQPQMAPVPMLTCKNCGKPAQADWKNCPYCGKKL